MRLWEFVRLTDSRVRIPETLGRPLGLVDGSQAFSAMFEYGDDGGMEVVISCLGPEDYRRLYDVTFHMRDEPGACAQVARFLGDLDVNILNSDSLSLISGVGMVWTMLVDISYLGEIEDLEERFETQRSAGALSRVDTMSVSESGIASRYAHGAVPGSTGFLARRMTRGAPGAIRDGVLTLPEEFADRIGDGTCVMMVADTVSSVLSLTPMRSEGVVEASLEVPDRPGSVGKAVGAIASLGINLLAVHSQVLSYNQRMALDVVMDVPETLGDLSKVHAALGATLEGEGSSVVSIGLVR